MGKSIASCFKIVTCRNDSVDHDDLQTAQVSSGQSGWSFRKRPARHRVLNSIVISKPHSSTDKESPETTVARFHVQPHLNVPEKTSVIRRVEQDSLSAQPEPNVSGIKATKEDDYNADATLDESSIILIQAAIRGYLARKLLLKQKNIIKLQAAVRGHLVRTHAVGTLRCVQAIVKMQALVRARRARLLAEGTGDFDNQKKNSAEHNLTVLSGKKEGKPNGTYTYISIEKLLSNKFARQLMESTPRTTSINIKCDPLKSDTAWKWLERWMSASSLSNEEPDESGSAAEKHEKENLGYSIPSDFQTELKDFECAVGPSAETSENDENLITYDEDNLNVHACSSISRSMSHPPHLQSMEESYSRYNIIESYAVEIKETDMISKVDIKSVPFKDETGNGQDTPDMESFSIEQPEIEEEMFPQKATNLSFVAAQSKFKELSSAAASEKITSLSSFRKISTSTYPPLRSKGTELNDNSISNVSAVQIAVSECGTELSISSTLDSPDMSEGGVNYLGQEPKSSDVNDHPKSRDTILKTNANSSILVTESSYSSTNQLETHENLHLAASERVDSTLDKKVEADEISSDLQVELGLEASPRSHMALSESQATPSNQTSLSSKKSRGGKSNSSGKKRSLSVGKKLLPNQDSPTQSSFEQLQKEHKTGKRRNSSGSAKLDRADQELRDSSSTNSVPSYMQATESARAKAVSNGSPRSSPDVQGQDIFKTRLSLPGKNGMQGSPHVHRSLSLAPQNSKGNGIHSPQERKWRR